MGKLTLVQFETRAVFEVIRMWNSAKTEQKRAATAKTHFCGWYIIDSHSSLYWIKDAITTGIMCLVGNKGLMGNVNNIE